MSKVGYNPFANLHLDESSSDEEEETKRIHIQPTAPNTPALQTKPNEASPSFRVWKLTKEEEQTRNTFGSPFSVKKKSSKTKQVHSQADHEGWVSIQKNKPVSSESANSSDSEKEIKKEALMEALAELSSLDAPAPEKVDQPQTTMRSLLNRGQHEMTALDWAERVRVNLEKAESHRRTSAGNDFLASLGRPSFFRKTEETK